MRFKQPMRPHAEAPTDSIVDRTSSLPSFRGSDAAVSGMPADENARFADPPAIISFAEASVLKDEERRELTRKIAVMGCALGILFVASLCVKPTLGAGFNNPLDVVQVLWLHVKWGLGGLVGRPCTLSYAQILQEYPVYYQVETRFAISAITVACGAMLALSGSLYQLVFRNPIAAPTMLGVSNGVSLGVLVLVVQFGASALEMEPLRHVYSYVGAVAVLLLVLGITRAICGWGKTFSGIELLLVGSIFSQVCGSVVTVLSDSYLTEELWEVYQYLNEGLTSTVSGLSAASVCIAVLAGVVPVFLMRYSINAMSYSDEESRLIGLDVTGVKFVSLVCGTIMIVVSQVNLGTVSMVSLVVPFISRATFGTEFKHQFWGDALIGSLLLLFCRDLVVLVPLFHMEMALGTVVSFIALPFYVWIVASRQRGWK